MPVPLIIIGGAAAVSIGSTVHSTWKSRKWKKIHAEALENFKPGMSTKVLSKSWSYEPSTGKTELTSYVPPAPNLCESGLRRAWELRSELQRRIDSDQRFQLSVSRWARAASPGVLNPDRVIDLRIALESLYLDSSGGN